MSQPSTSPPSGTPSPQPPYRVSSVQFQHAPGDKAANLATVRRFAEQAARRQSRLVLFPECCLSGYWHLRRLDRQELRELAEPIPDGHCTQTVLSWARELDISIGVGLVERTSDDQLYNSFIVAMPDGRVACHRKLHCFVSQHMQSGSHYTVFDLPAGPRAAVLICYDNNLVENARICALQGAELLLAPHQTGGCKSGSPHAMGRIDPVLWDRREEDPETIRQEFLGDKGRGWLMRWLPARAHDNGLFLVFSNGVGFDDGEVRTGNAMILDPYGRVLAETSEPADALVEADLDLTLRERATGTRWLRARRPELYQPLTAPTGHEADTRSVRFQYDSLPDGDAASS